MARKKSERSIVRLISRLSPGETAMILDDSKPVVFLYDEEIQEMVVKALEMAQHKPKRVVLVDTFHKVDLPEGHIRYEEYVKEHSEDNPPRERPGHIYDREHPSVYLRYHWLAQGCSAE